MKILKIIGAVVGIFVLGFVVLAMLGPETSVYSGKQLPAKYIKVIESMDLIEQNESIKYFYSDAIYDIRSGMYFVTDKNLVLYSKAWAEPANIIPLNSIKSVYSQAEDSFNGDIVVTVITDNDDSYIFPVSVENGTDKHFIDALYIK